MAQLQLLQVNNLPDCMGKHFFFFILLWNSLFNFFNLTFKKNVISAEKCQSETKKKERLQTGKEAESD